MKEVTIGSARLIFGDAFQVVPELMFDSVVSDPPFGMAFRSNHRKTRHKHIANDHDSEALIWACSIPVNHSRYVFCRWDNLVQIPKPRSLITWVKNNWSMGDLEHEHARQTEVAAFYPGPSHFFPSGRPQDVIRAPRTGNEHHPTEKPVQLMQAFVSWTDGVVLDPFMGSASTLIACMRMNRPCIGVEDDPEHFETAVRRVTEAAQMPADMFVARSPEPVQEALNV